MKKMKIILPILIALALAALPSSDECDCGAPLAGLMGIFGCSDHQAPGHEHAEETQIPRAPGVSLEASPVTETSGPPKVTFVEIGSENCIPCRMMKPVLKAVEDTYGSQIRVVFHDVWTPDGKANAMKYGIRVIPTQVFLDKDGKEYFRHEGFFPKEQVDIILRKKGVR